MHDALLEDAARLEDPHLWSRARELDLDLERFDADRRGEAAEKRVNEDFRGGIRAGVVTTPALFRLGPEGPERVVIDLLEEQLSR
jgi:hypothetical protein